MKGILDLQKKQITRFTKMHCYNRNISSLIFYSYKLNWFILIKLKCSQSSFLNIV